MDLQSARYLAGLMQKRWGEGRKDVLLQSFGVSSTKDLDNGIGDELIDALKSNNSEKINELLTPTK